jgi:hypothetical protein
VTALLARCDDEDVRWLGASFRKLAELRRQSALPQPSCTERSIAREMQLHLPLAPLQNSGYGFKNDFSTCEALRNLAVMRKHLRCLLRCLYRHQQYCAPRWAGGTRFMQRHRRQECAGSKEAQMSPSIIECTAPPAAAWKPPTTVRNNSIVEANASPGRHRSQALHS